MNGRPEIVDCVVVGGGPAGLTAALYLARFLRSVTVIDAQNGRAAMIPNTHNMAAFPAGISGHNLLARMRVHAELSGASVEHAFVRSIEKKGEIFEISTNVTATMARNVILATGVFNHRPFLSKQVHDQGIERGLIRYCPICDAREIQGKRIAVLGNTTHGFDEASFIRHYSASVTLIPPDKTKAIASRGIAVLRSPMKKLALSDSTVMVSLENGETHHFDTLYVALGTSPQTHLAAHLGVNLDEEGYVKIDAKQRTSVDRIYAVGDIVAGLDQIAVAMGHGAIAATAIHNDLSKAQFHS